MGVAHTTKLDREDVDELNIDDWALTKPAAMDQKQTNIPCF